MYWFFFGRLLKLANSVVLLVVPLVQMLNAGQAVALKQSQQIDGVPTVAAAEGLSTRVKLQTKRQVRPPLLTV